MNSFRSLVILAFISCAAALTATAQVETYKIDPAHSSVGFGIRHFFTKVPGVFTKFSGAITVDRANLEKSSVEATIDVTSVNTTQPKRDAHLQSPDFFKSSEFPSITFKSTSWKKTGDTTYDVTGDLTMKGVTKPVVLKVKSLGFGPGMGGSKISGWEASTMLDRRDFGISYGQGMVSNDVDVSINVEAVLK